MTTPSLLWTRPAELAVASVEVRRITIDISGILDSGQTPTNPIATLVDEVTNVALTNGLVDLPTIDGTIISVVVQNLVANHNYRLVVTFDIVATLFTRAIATMLKCEF
jgi:hypothetical protein